MGANNPEDTSDEANKMALRVMNQHLADLVALAHDAIIVRDPANIIFFWNQGAEQLYGWTQQEAIGQVSHILLQTHFPQSHELIHTILEQQGRWEGLLTHIRRDGEQVIVESRQVLVHNAGNQQRVSDPSTAILEINRDITEREHLQREQTEAQARELALHETKERMDEFLGVVSHELRTPMTTIKGNIQLAKYRLQYAAQSLPADNGTLSNTLEEIQIMLDRAERQVNVQNRLIRDLLDISRIQVEQLELQPDQYDLIPIVNEAVEDLRSAIPGRTIHHFEPAEETIPVFADAERIGQVISNYLTNALKYSPEDRPVEVRVKKEGVKVRISVRDHGPGLSPVEQERVWERFYRVEGIKRQRGFGLGLGLGLHICQAIIKQHEGEVGVESTEGEGSTFWFTLPIAEEECQAKR
ncbi:MAG: PAS domain-containing sensor histidine kinase [Ktedonobacteraceae bacterium]